MAIISVNKGDYYYNYDTPLFSKTSFPTHFHQNYELMYFVSGKATFIVEGSEYTASAGDIFFTRPQELHSILLRGGKYTRHFFQFSRVFVSGLFGDYNLLEKQDARKSGTRNKIPAALVEKYALGTFFMRLHDEMTNLRPETAVLVQSLTVQMLLQINDLLKKHEIAETEGTFFEQEGAGDADVKIRKIKECIKSHAVENISLDEIADEVFMNKFYLCRFFKEHTGISPKQYVSIIRIHRARNLIAQGLQLADVVEQCGFSDYSSFYRTFVKVSGITPGEFKKDMNTPISIS